MPKATPRRPRSDSAKAAVQAAQAAALGPFAPPAHITLRPQDRPFWDAVMLARARDTWTEVDLIAAANLARTQADIEMLQATLDAEGYMVEGKVHPAAELVEKLTRRCVTLMRVLHVHAQATVGRSEDAGKALDLERAARAQEDDDLIPRLRAVK